MSARAFLVGGSVVAILAGAGTIWGLVRVNASLRAEKAVLGASLEAVKQANADNLKTIELITDLRDKTDVILTDVSTKLEAINAETSALSAALDRLDKDDPEASEYLRTRIPDSVKRLLRR